MLEIIKNLFTKGELLEGNYGIEREGLRIDNNGDLSSKPHPDVFGNKVDNEYITTDFSESQVEVITPAFSSIEETYNFTNALYDIVSMEIGEEYIWPQSMPSIVPEDDKIPVAEYEEGISERAYRERLLRKYGGKKQLICGIHYNFSFSEKFIKKLYDNTENKLSYKEFKNEIYLKIARNYLRYRWLMIYLLGSTSVLHDTYLKEECKEALDEISVNSYSNSGALSYRNGKYGYKNKVNLFPKYDSLDEYVESINGFIDDKLIESHKELYSAIRLKPNNKSDFFNSLINDGIKYLEFRSIDINPFEKGGISLDDLYFFQIFNIFLLLEEESEYDEWQEEALENENLIAQCGLNEVMLKKDGKLVSKEKWALEILDGIKRINKELDLEREDLLEKIADKIKNYKLTYAYKIKEKVKEKGYINAHLNLAKEYKKSSYDNRYRLQGYEDLELSTQILMRESIKRGIKVNILDRNENFISLKNGNHIEYIKQATKTSKDSYVTMLIMENKSVTKKVLKDGLIKVPKGREFQTIDEALRLAQEFENIPIVIKPKSTNFGTGISIFKYGTSAQNVKEAFKIAFKYDETVLVEEFIKGKEYRFLVINDKVSGILHRVPANVKGNGVNTIEELVKIKNKDSLRGYHHRTPLEKIQLDEHVKIFLRDQKKDLNYIPKEDEIVYLRENSNISTGGDSIDYSDDIPKKFKDIAVNAAKAVNAKICGVDMIIEDYKDENSDYAIIELNFNPAIHIHCYPYVGKERNIAIEILKLLEFVK